MQERFVAIGVDPDTFATGLALVSCALPQGAGEPQGLTVEMVRVAEAEGPDARARLMHMAPAVSDAMYLLIDEANYSLEACVVEGQAHRPGDKRPDDIVQLAVVQGMAASALCAHLDSSCALSMPLPVQWKGSLKKRKHQALVLKQLGLADDLPGVPGAEGLTDKQRGHVVDAIGLAVWGLERLVVKERATRFLA